MSLQQTMRRLNRQGIQGLAVTASDTGIYLKEWLVFLASLKDATWHLQNAHWNARSRSWKDIHEFFGAGYTKLFELQDTVAEHIKATDIAFEIPNSPALMSQLSLIHLEQVESLKSGTTEGLEIRAEIHLSYYCIILDKLIAIVKLLNQLAEKQEDIAGLNMLGEIMQDFKKIRWQISSYLP